MKRKYRVKYESGTYKRKCDKTGFYFKRNELVREPQTGLLVYPDYADKVHPSDIPYDYPVSTVRIE